MHSDPDSPALRPRLAGSGTSHPRVGASVRASRGLSASESLERVCELGLCDHRAEWSGHRLPPDCSTEWARRVAFVVRRAVVFAPCGTGGARLGRFGPAGSLPRHVPRHLRAGRDGRLTAASAAGAAGPAGGRGVRDRAARAGRPGGVSGVRVSGVTLRASDVRPGDLFAALPGSRAHGADFAAQALAAGAAAVLTDADGATRPGLGRGARARAPAPARGAGPGRRARLRRPDGPAVGARRHRHQRQDHRGAPVEAGLAAAARPAGVVGTVGTRIAGHKVPSALTTPEAPDLQALFAVMAEQGVTDVAMEVSSHALALGRVSGTRFTVAAFTNLSRDHLDFHHTMDEYFEAKAALFDGRAEHHVICVDDEWGRRLAERHPGRGHRRHHRRGGLAGRRPHRRRRRRPALHRRHARRHGAGGAAAAARRVQRRERAGGAREPGRGRGARCDGRRRVRRPGRAGADAADRGGAAVPGGRRLRPQAGRRRRAAGRAAPAGARPADRRARLRRRPRPRQAPDDGRGRRGAVPRC